jgi:hypothetical protein
MKKLALIAAVAVLVVAAVWLRPTHDDTVAPPATTATTAARPSAARPSAAAPTTPAVTAAPETGGPYGGTAEARRQWEPTVQGFALAYPDTDGLTRKQWLANLRPYLQRPVLDALAGTELDKVPHGHYAGYQPLKVADEAITIRVTYQEGWALVLYLAANGDGAWSIDALDETLDFD